MLQVASFLLYLKNFQHNMTNFLQIGACIIPTYFLSRNKLWERALFTNKMADILQEIKEISEVMEIQAQETSNMQ